MLLQVLLFLMIPLQLPQEVALTPMGAEEAVEALEAVGHDFYVFMDATTGGVQVCQGAGEWMGGWGQTVAGQGVRCDCCCCWCGCGGVYAGGVCVRGTGRGEGEGVCSVGSVGEHW